MSVGLSVESADLERLRTRLYALSKLTHEPLLESLGAIVESQTRRRFTEEKADPKGKRWRDWSEEYAASKHGKSKNHEPHPGDRRESQGHSILFLDGDLHDSMHFQTAFDEVEIGSNMDYAAAQNEMRQFIGLSPQNTDEVLETIEDYIDREMGLK